MKNLLVVALLAMFISACATNPITESTTRYDNKTNTSVTESVTSTASQSTMKLMTRAKLAQAVCTAAGNDYKDYLVLSNTNVEFLPIVIQDGQYIQLPEEAKIKFNNTVNRPSATAFNMSDCVEGVTKTGMERFFTGFFKDVFSFGRDVIPYGAGFLVADKFLDFLGDNTGVEVNGVEAGATVAVGSDDANISIDQRSDNAGDNSTFNTCAGEIIEGQCVLPAQAQETDGERTCTGEGGEIVDDNGDGINDRLRKNLG